jgi:hypothetical protein
MAFESGLSLGKISDYCMKIDVLVSGLSLVSLTDLVEYRPQVDNRL